MGQARVVHGHAGGRQALGQLVLQRGGDLFHVGAQGDGVHGVGIILGVVVGVDARHMAQRGFRLHGDIALVIVHVKKRLGGIGHMPHHHVGDLDGIAHLVVDFQAFAVQGAHAGGDGGGVALGGFLSCGLGCL